MLIDLEMLQHILRGIQKRALHRSERERIGRGGSKRAVFSWGCGIARERRIREEEVQYNSRRSQHTEIEVTGRPSLGRRAWYVVVKRRVLC